MIQASDHRPINREAERIVVRVDADLRDLIPRFLLNQESDRIRLRRAFEAGEYETVRKIGHNMKGAGGGYGFDELTAIGADIEAAAIREDTSGLALTLDQLERFLAGLEVEFEIEFDEVASTCSPR